MPTYVNLFNWTDQGIKNFRDTVKRAEAVEEQMAQLGVSLREILWTQGKYDIVAISEAPDDETGTAFLLGLGSQGNVRSMTMRAFDREEMGKIVARLG